MEISSTIQLDCKVLVVYLKRVSIDVIKKGNSDFGINLDYSNITDRLVDL